MAKAPNRERNISFCPEYEPTEEEFEDPLWYLQKIAPEASKYGICKIRPFLKASVPAADVLNKETKDFHFQTVAQPLRLAPNKISYSAKCQYSYDAFVKKANYVFNCKFPRTGVAPSIIEQYFWRDMAQGKTSVEYAVNVKGSAFSSNPQDQLAASNWNLKNLLKLPHCVLRELDSATGLPVPVLSIGMMYSYFTWHVKDHYLYSIDYHHSGEPKTWYAVPGHQALQFETTVMNHVFADKKLSTVGEDGVFQELAENPTMFFPGILQENGLTVYKAVQMAGEFVVTFPRAYHAGFCNGFNCCEAVNFAIGDWFPFGKEATDRYARFTKQMILPYEKLLTVEALSLYECTRKTKLNYSDPQFASPASIIASFADRIASLRTAALCLENLNVQLRYQSNSVSIFCQLCKRDCFLAFIQLGDNNICPFHELDSIHKECGGNLILWLREDMKQLVKISRALERERVTCGIH